MRGEGIHEPGTMSIVELTDSDVPAVLDALQAAFGGSFDTEWFEWKHRSGPWGRSPGWVARDDDGLIGVRVFLPWRFRDEQGEYRALRPCDTVTVPRARGRGVFRKLTEHAIANIDSQVDFLFNTPNDQSKPGYLKMGFSEWARVEQRVGLVSPRSAVLTEEVGAPPPGAESTMGTDRTEEFLDWRYGRCPTYDYRILALAEADTANGIVCRSRSWRRQQVMIVDECWGGNAQEKVLVRAAARLMGARLVWTTDRLAHTVLVSWSRSHTDVTRFDLSDPSPGVPSFSVGDIESVL